MGKWKLVNSKEPDGLLSNTTKFLSPKNKQQVCFQVRQENHKKRTIY